MSHPVWQILYSVHSHVVQPLFLPKLPKLGRCIFESLRQLPSKEEEKAAKAEEEKDSQMKHLELNRWASFGTMRVDLQTGVMILLMAEILRHPTSCIYLQGFIRPKWCRMSSINSRFIPFSGCDLFFKAMHPSVIEI